MMDVTVPVSSWATRRLFCRKKPEEPEEPARPANAAEGTRGSQSKTNGKSTNGKSVHDEDGEELNPEDLITAQRCGICGFRRGHQRI